MASISPTFPPPSSSTRPDPNPHKFAFHNTRIPSKLKRSSYSLSTSHHSFSRGSDSTLCRCRDNNKSSDSSGSFRWDSAVQEVVRNAVKWFDDNLSSVRRRRGELKDVARRSVGVVERRSESVEDSDDDEDWDWDRWRKHFDEVDEQERVASILKSQLAHAVSLEDFEDASCLKVAIAAAATNDTVGRVMLHLTRAIKEERYRDAAFVRDYAGAGLVGWWAGIAENSNDPCGRIIRISAEHGRYVARSYSPGQLATATAGTPLFEIFLTVNRNGEYKQQAVYLRQMGPTRDFPFVSSKPLDPTGSLNTLDSTANKPDLFAGPEDSEDTDDDSSLPGFDNVLRDMIPGVKFKVFSVTAPENVDPDLISKAIEQMIDEEDEEKDTELESVDTEDDEGESDQEQKETEVNASDEVLDGEQQSEIAVMCNSDGLVQKVIRGVPNENLIRVPARLEKKGRLSFSFSVEKDEIKGQRIFEVKLGNSPKKAKHGIDHVKFDMAKYMKMDLEKFMGGGRIPMRVIKDIGFLLAFTVHRAQNFRLLSGSTTFSRIEIPASPDPLNGLYIGADELLYNEVIHLRRKVGQWQEDGGGSKEPLNPEFYEYVEAIKLTGDSYVPAGQVAFRAKVGKRYQLPPHKGIIPKELGVIARYKGQGRLAEPGFLNPRWVDGELIIIDGKFFSGGPVVCFMSWAPGSGFLVFFKRLRLQE